MASKHKLSFAVPLLVNTVMAQDYGYISVMMEALNGS